MNMLINHFIIASRAYSQQSPTCTRVNNLVYIFSIQHSWCLTLMESQCWSCLLVEEVLSVLCTIQFFMSFAKLWLSPNLTSLYHLMINFLSSHDRTHHHMMNITCLVIEWDIRIPLCLYDVWLVKWTFSQHMHLEITQSWNNFLKPKYYILFQSSN